MGSLVAAYRGNIPLIVTAGQQTREMVLCEPYLTNRDETVFPQPWVKWAYQPARAEDVPAAFMRAYAVALQPPAGPVFLSIPLDDWEKPALGPAVVRTVSHRVSPDTQRLRSFADRINRAERPLLVFGSEVDRSGAWEAGVRFAEKVGAPVYGSPLPDRVSFPEDHRLYQGPLPMTIAGVTGATTSKSLAIRHCVCRQSGVRHRLRRRQRRGWPAGARLSNLAAAARGSAFSPASRDSSSVGPQRR